MRLTEYLLERYDEEDGPLLSLPPAEVVRNSEGQVSARGDGWVTRGDCMICGHYLYDGTESVTEDAYWEHLEIYHHRSRRLATNAALRKIVQAAEPQRLVEWTPDCGGDWVLSGDDRYFANYWPDNTVAASINEPGDPDGGRQLESSGITKHRSRAEAMAWAEQWIREHLPNHDPVLRLLAQVYVGREDFDPRWKA